MSLPVPLYALVTKEEKRKTKNGDRFFWQVTLKTEVGSVKAFMWNVSVDVEKDMKFPHTADIIEVVDFQDQMEERNSIVINAFKRITKEDLPDQDLLEFDKASKADIDWALELIGDSSFWDDKANHDFTMNCLKEIGADKLRTCPAATHIHHQYQGGLLVHTAEVLEMCRAVVESSRRRYPFINQDVVYCSAILHDIGKAYTYSINDMGAAESLLTEKTIGHLFYGMNLVQKVWDADTQGFVFPEFVNEVLHCIATHHGLPEYGSLKVVQSIEAGILSRVDYISSRNGMVDSVLKDSLKANQPLQESFKIYGDPYFASIGMKEFVSGGKQAG